MATTRDNLARKQIFIPANMPEEENIVKTQEVIEYYGKYWLICHTDMPKIGL